MADVKTAHPVWKSGQLPTLRALAVGTHLLAEVTGNARSAMLLPSLAPICKVGAMRRVYLTSLCSPWLGLLACQGHESGQKG